MEYLELQTEVERALIDLPDAVQAAVPRLVKFAHRQLQKKHNFWVMKKHLTGNTTVSTRIWQVGPSNFKAFREGEDPWYEASVGSNTHFTVATDKSYITREIEVDDEGPPRYLVKSDPTDELGGFNLEVWPLPDGNSDWTDAPEGEYRIKLPYWGYLAELSADDDEDWLTINGDQYIINRAVAEGFALDWDAEGQTEWLGRAQEQFQEVVKLDRMMRLAGTDTLVPHYQGAKSSMLRRR